jgi:hypothetical protein
MRIDRQLVTACLSFNKRALDVLFVLLASAGINVMTSAYLQTSWKEILIAGCCITAAAVILSMMNYRVGQVDEEVSAQRETDNRRIELLIRMGNLNRVEIRSTREIREEVLGAYYTGRESAKVIILLGAVVGLFSLGVVVLVANARLYAGNATRPPDAEIVDLQRTLSSIDNKMELMLRYVRVSGSPSQCLQERSSGPSP